MFDLRDKTALVTGVSGGIGEAVVRALHAQGATEASPGQAIPVLRDRRAGEGIDIR
jgi:3-oxoacyl-[acyl-carrier protein] reductase